MPSHVLARLATLGGVAALLSFTAIDRPAAQAAPTPIPLRYTVEDLTVPGTTSSTADAINEIGVVVGWTLGSRERAFRFAGARSVHLDTLGATLGGARSNATGLTFGAVTGWSNPAGNRALRRGFISDRAGTRDIGSLGGADTLPRDIEGGSNPLIAGTASLPNGNRHAFLYTGGPLRDLGTLGGRDSYGQGVNNLGWVTGAADLATTGTRHAFLFDGTSMRDLGTLGGRNSAGRAITFDRVIGYAATAAGDTHAFVYDGVAMRDLGTLGGSFSDGYGINEAGTVVGESRTASGALHAFIYQDGRMHDLNSFIDPASGWVLVSARDINSYGQIVGHGTYRGTTRAFRLSPPNDILAAVRSVTTDEVGNRPRPLQAGRELFWLVGVWNETGPGAYVTLVDTVSGPVEILSARAFPDEPFSFFPEAPAGCNVAGKVITCTAYLSDGGFGQDFIIRLRTLAAGTFSHSVTASSRIADLDPSNNSDGPEHNTAVSLSDLEITPAAIAGGRSASLRVRLTSAAPASNNGVRLTSSNPEVLPVLSTLNVPGGTTRATNIVPKVVSIATPVDITATYGLVSKTVTFTVLPPALSAFSLTPTTVIGGCGTVSTRVTLSGSAPPAGANVPIAESIAAARFPPSIAIEAGAATRTISVPTNYVTVRQVGTVTASYGGVSRAITHTVRPIRARSISAPNPIVGGATVTGTVTLECASPTPIVVALSSSSSALASPVVPSITIPAGKLTGSFGIKTADVSAVRTVSIYARVYGVRSSKALTLNP